MKKIVIAIDGFSGTGKSTIAKKVAKELEYVYIDSGAMYRAATLLGLKEGLIGDGKDITIDKQRIMEALERCKMEFRTTQQGQAMFLNGENVEKEIRSMRVGKCVSQVAKIGEIRCFLVKKQREMGKDKAIVMDGRDIASVVFPDAELKIFMVASDKVRAERRLKELLEKGEKTNFEEVIQNLKERDEIDSQRKESPLVEVKEAIRIDNSQKTMEEIVEEIVKLAREKERE